MSLAWLHQNRAVLARSGVLRQALRIALIEQALSEAQIPLPPAKDLKQAVQAFWRQRELPPPKRAAWLLERDLSEEDLALMVSRPERWRQWCGQRWQQKQEALFLKHKNQLDQASASVLRLEEEGLARELYLQLLEQESSFAELVSCYCQDHPQRQGGQWGPKPLSELPPALAELVRTTPVGQLREPQCLAPRDWVVLRVDSFTGCRLDDPAVGERLLRLEGEAWLEQHMQAWMKG
jgi:parvulin-like peptidyl-prolyl isomerase